MQQISRKQFTLIAVVIVVLIVAAIVLAMMGNKSGSTTPGNNPVGTGRPTSPGAPSSTAPVTRLPLPANVAVPEEGASSTANVAVPQTESAAAPGVAAKYRSFNISVTGSAFTPDTVAVNQGDTVNLEITATGGSYDFTQPDFGFNASLPVGQTKTIQFQATASGKFIFYCSSCGGPSKGPVGYLLVAGK